MVIAFNKYSGDKNFQCAWGDKWYHSSAKSKNRKRADIIDKKIDPEEEIFQSKIILRLY